MPPLEVRCRVALRQLGWKPEAIEKRLLSEHRHSGGLGYGWLLDFALGELCMQLTTPRNELPLDHDPALILRKYNPRIKDVAARYTPHAHDPDALIYRRKGNHDEKTFGRKEGAERTVTTKGSDIWLKSKFNRLEGRTKKREKKKWPEGRKLQSRGFQQRRPS